MISPSEFLSWLTSEKITQFAGVPDSVLKGLIAGIASNPDVDHHVTTANEGAAVAYAIGCYLERGQPAAVYMQNSGLGNALNPLISLAHKRVYGIPVLLVIGWRGEPGRHDEPQHLPQGAATRALLDAAGIANEVLDSSEAVAKHQVLHLIMRMRLDPQPHAILVPAKVFNEYKVGTFATLDLPLTREGALELVIQQIPQNARVVVTAGMLGREFWELRHQRSETLANDFLATGGMGHAVSIAHGIAQSSPFRPVWCLDGDGSVIMHLGTLPVIGAEKLRNLKHIVFNNFSHDSVGGQRTSAATIEFPVLARSVGYNWAKTVKSKSDVLDSLTQLDQVTGPALLEIQVRPGARENIGRPPAEIFQQGMTFAQPVD